MAITSRIRQILAMGEAALHDWQQAGLIKPSVMKPLIMTLEKGKIIQSIGKLSDKDRLQLNDCLMTIIGINK